MAPDPPQQVSVFENRGGGVGSSKKLVFGVEGGIFPFPKQKSIPGRGDRGGPGPPKTSSSDTRGGPDLQNLFGAVQEVFWGTGPPGPSN